MKKWVHSTDVVSDMKVEAIKQPKLKRTLESGHSYEGDITFDTVEDMKKWLKEDELYED